MIFNLKPCHVMCYLVGHDGVQTASARCDVHEWEVIDTFERGATDPTAVRWAMDEGRKHEALFRRIAVERARAQVALDEDLQRRLVNAVAWDGDRFDGYFLSGVLSLEVELPPDAEEDDNGQ
jgi:hypothetical protein